MIRLDESGILWGSITLDPARLAGDLAPSSATATGPLRDDPSRTVYVWEPPGRPRYQFVGTGLLRASDARWTGAMIITLPHRALRDLPSDADDPAQAFPVEGGEASLRVRTLQRAMYTHLADLEHADAGVTAALVEAAGPAATLRAQFQGAMMREYGILAIPQAAVAHACSWCGGFPGRKLPQCECRQGLRYCSVACQRAHWRGGHRERCTRAPR